MITSHDIARICVSYLTLTHKDKNTEVDCIRHLHERCVDGIIIILPIGLVDTASALNGLPMT